MCGIFGEFSRNLIDRPEFMRILSLSKSRGPDSTEYYTNNKNLQLGFNRLSVIDLSDNGNQPIHSQNKRFTMVYNGEAYNYLEIRNKLERLGYKFKGNGDSEVVINAFEGLGVKKTVNLLDGMFAIGLFDHFRKVVFLIRDFAGIKPLFYGWNGKSLVFASQYNQISRHPVYNKEEINQQVLKLYLKQHFVPPPFGLLNKTYCVKPGEIISFNLAGEKKVKNYWAFPKYYDTEISENIPLELIDSELRSSVRSELISDVPLGCFLSGGVDSPLVSYNASVLSNNLIETFSLGSDSNKYDESYYANQYSKHLKTKHNTTLLNSNNAIDVLEKSVLSAGEPLGDLSILPTWELSKMASKKVTVALSGDGGDELFFGYERFQSIANNHWLKELPYSMKYLLWGLDKLTLNSSYINDCILYRSPGEAHFGLNSRFPDDTLNNVVPNLKNINFPEDYKNYNYTSPNDINELFYMIRKAEYYGMMQKTLAKVDRASMAHGLEVRVPFLKKTMIEKVISLGISIHQPQKLRKKFLYQLLVKKFPGIQPYRKKRGFSVPLSMWIRTGLRDSFSQVLLDEKFCHTYDINNLVLENILNSHLNKQVDVKWPLFTLYSLAIWSKEGRANV